MAEKTKSIKIIGDRVEWVCDMFAPLDFIDSFHSTVPDWRLINENS